MSTSTKRKRALIAGVAAVVVAAGIAGASVQATGAWFTATKTASGNSVTAGTLSLDNLGSSAGGLITATNAFPMTDSQATDATATVPTANVIVKNNGTLPLDWTLSLSSASITKASNNTASGTPATSKVRVAYKLPGSSTWTATALDTFISSPPAALVKPGTDLAAGGQVDVPVRVFFDSSVGNEYQGASVGFTAKVDAVQVNQQ